MTTPAINLQMTIRLPQKVERFANGVRISVSETTVPGNRYGRSRPESVYNAVRSDGTRKPSSWVSTGGAISGVMGTASRFYSVGATHYEDRVSGCLGPSAFGAGQSIATVFSDGEIMAIRKALGNFTKSHMQLGAALRESRQTGQLLKRYYDGARSGVEQLTDSINHKGQLRNQMRDFARHGWKAAPSRYLEYLFGIKPLADDLTNAVQVLHDTRQHQGAFNLTLKGQTKYERTQNMSAFQSYASFVSRVYANVSIKQRSRASLVFQLPEWYWDRLPPVTFFSEIHETNRLSFVLDWVLPVNSYIAGFEGLQLRPFFREGSRSTKLERVVSGPECRDAGITSALSLRAGLRDSAYRRQAMSAFPTGELLMRLPRISQALGWDQIRVSASLLGQKLVGLQRAIDHSPKRRRTPFRGGRF